MKTYTIDNENSISVFATAEEAAAATTTPFDTFSSRQELADLIAAWPPERLAATFNSLPGVAPVPTHTPSNFSLNLRVRSGRWLLQTCAWNNWTPRLFLLSWHTGKLAGAAGRGSDRCRRMCA